MTQTLSFQQRAQLIQDAKRTGHARHGLCVALIKAHRVRCKGAGRLIQADLDVAVDYLDKWINNMLQGNATLEGWIRLNREEHQQHEFECDCPTYGTL